MKITFRTCRLARPDWKGNINWADFQNVENDFAKYGQSAERERLPEVGGARGEAAGG